MYCVYKSIQNRNVVGPDQRSRFLVLTKRSAASGDENDDLCGNLIWEYFCWMLGDPHFFFGRSLPFLILAIIPKNKKNLYVGSFNYFSYTIQIGSNWCMDTGMRDLEVACFKANST